MRYAGFWPRLYANIGARENLHGLLTVNLGVYVPEVARHHRGGGEKSRIQSHHCCIRARLGKVSGETTDLWWPATSGASVVIDVVDRLTRFGVPFLERFSSRERILSELAGKGDNQYLTVPRIVSAIILAVRGRTPRTCATSPEGLGSESLLTPGASFEKLPCPSA